MVDFPPAGRCLIKSNAFDSYAGVPGDYDLCGVSQGDIIWELSYADDQGGNMRTCYFTQPNSRCLVATPVQNNQPVVRQNGRGQTWDLQLTNDGIRISNSANGKTYAWYLSGPGEGVVIKDINEVNQTWLIEHIE
ncbi:hypothetical protein M405DRAFT_816043 [Rhizopogon salebrosus TDB-379]|nr:hypothetical protein M405DRAFT_816043 [Rhizopogon salebrosus TDB-379]